jgi:hypothetical protein
MQQMKQHIYTEIFVAFFIWLLIWCYRMPPSTELPTKHRTKGFIFSFFREGIFSLNNFLQVFDYERDYFQKNIKC